MDDYKTDDLKMDVAGQDDTWGTWGSTDKKKGKKGMVSDDPPPPAPTPPAQGLTPEPGPTEMPDLDDFGGDSWGGLGTAKTKTSVKKGTLSRTTTSTSKTSKSDETKAKSKDLKEDKVATTSPKDDKAGAKKDVVLEESAAKAVKSMWGNFGTTASGTAKTKSAREKEEKARKEAEEEEKAKQKAEEAAAAAAEAAEAAKALENSKKSSKSKVGTGKLSRTTSKSSDKSDDKKKKVAEDPMLDILEEAAPKEEKGTSKLKKAGTKVVEAKVAEPIVDDAKDDDYFGFNWAGGSSSKKTTGKKDAEAKKEITKQTPANQKNTLVSFAYDPEDAMADEPPSTTKSSKTMSAVGTKGKLTSGTSSVAARIKALEGGGGGGKEEERKKSKADPWLTKDKDLPAPDPEPSPKEEKKANPLSKSKSLTASSSKAAKKKETPLPVAEEKKSKDSVPGSFPGGFGDDDELMNFDDFPATPEKKSSTKKSKDDRKSSSKAKTPKIEDLVVEAPEPPKLPTPPPEKDKKPVKKERARVERTGTATSWGFWGAAPPKKATKDSSKAKDDSDVSPPPSTKKEKNQPPLSRSKSTRTPREKEREEKKEIEKSSKSSGSDKDVKTKRPDSRTAKSARGMSFSNFMMGGPPPSAMPAKVARRSSTAGTSSKASSRRQSIDRGLASPPPDDYQPELTDKAAKLMGMKTPKLDRKLSTRGKAKGRSNLFRKTAAERQPADTSSTAVPDPYPIDDDDMVMVNGLEDPMINGRTSTAKEKISTKDKSKQEVCHKCNRPKRPSISTNQLGPGVIGETQADGFVPLEQTKSRKSKDISNDDDVVMVEAGPSGGEPLVTSGPDDMAFVDHPPPALRRSNTTAKKAGGLFGSFFGGAAKPRRNSDGGDRSQPKSVYRDEKERLLDEPEESLPIRSKSKTKRRSTRPAVHNDGEGFTTDAGGVTAAEADAEAEARRAERRAKRDAKEAALREAEEADRLEREERRRKRQEREKADLEAKKGKKRDLARKEQEAEEQRREEKRARRTTREVKSPEEPEPSAEAEKKREERRRLRTQLEAEKAMKDGEMNGDGIRDDRRKSRAIDDDDRRRRHDDRRMSKVTKDKDRDKSSSKRQSTAVMEEYYNTRNGAGGQPAPPDKISSWVHSQAEDPPDVPPLEATILDGEKPRSLSPEGEKKPRRKDGRRSERDSRKDVKSMSGGSAEDRDRERRRVKRRDTVATEEYDAYADGGPVKNYDGRPVLAREPSSKRNSFFGKLGGFI